MQPALTIDGAVLNPVWPSDLAAIRDLLHDPQVLRFLCDNTVLSTATIEHILARGAQLGPRGMGYWGIDLSSGGLAGLAGLQPMTEELSHHPGVTAGIEPIIALYPHAWGQGLATRAVMAMVRHAFDTCGVDRLVGAVDVPNERSHRMMRRCGFAPIGTTMGPVYEAVLYERLNPQPVERPT